jgi:hypothetical protein
MQTVLTTAFQHRAKYRQYLPLHHSKGPSTVYRQFFLLHHSTRPSTVQLISYFYSITAQWEVQHSAGILSCHTLV